MFTEKVLKSIKNLNEFEERKVIDMINRNSYEELPKIQGFIKFPSNLSYLKKLRE